MSKFLLVSAAAGGSTRQHRTRETYNRILRTEVDVDGDGEVAESALQSAVKKVGGYSLPEVPKCEGCGSRPHECWGTCGGTTDGMGTCHKCDSAEGSKGACCLEGGHPHPSAKETNDCPKAVEYPAVNHTDYPYHVCVLTETIGNYSLPEVPKCEGCGWRPHECWGTCGNYDAPGPCDKCDSAEGSKGACCREGNEANDGAECQNAVEYPPGASYHVCVLIETTSTTSTSTTTSSSTASTTAAPAEAGSPTGLVVGGVAVLLLLAAAAAAFGTRTSGSGDGGGAEGAVEGEAKEKGEEDEDEESVSD